MPKFERNQNPGNAFSLVRTALPIGGFYLTEILVGLTDLAVVGALGTAELAAVGLGKTILLSVMVVGFAVLSIGTVLMAEKPTPIRCGGAGLASFALVFPFLVIAVVAAEATRFILTKTGYDLALIDAFSDYSAVLAWAIAPALVFAVLKNVLNAVARSGVLVWLSVGIVLGNLLISIVLVHGIGSWSGLGVAGAAWGTLAVNMGAALSLFMFVMRSGFVSFRRARSSAICRLIAEITRIGWAAGAQQALESVLFIVVLFLLGLYSTAWLAAGTVVFAVMELNYAMSGALGEVLAARIAAFRSEGPAALRRLLRQGGVVSGSAALILGLTVSVFAEATVALFSSSSVPETSRTLMVDLLRWTAPFFVCDAWQIVFIHALRGLRQTVIPMVLSTSCYWMVGLGGGMLLAEFAGLGASGIWIGFCLGLTSAAALLAVMAFRAAQKITH